MAKKPSYEELSVKVEELEKELKKARCQSDHIRGEQAQFATILDSIQESGYVLDLDTYEVLYANEFLKKALKHDPTGGKCHQELNRLSDPCGFCPVTDMPPQKEASGRYSWDFYNPVVDRYYMV
jgi:hypothetical protein